MRQASSSTQATFLSGRSRRHVLAAAATAAVILVSGGASAQQGGPIKIGTVAALSGQPAGLAKTYLDGLRAYIKAVNERGGVNGRQIEHIFEDDGFEIPRAVAGIQKLAQRDRVVAFLGAYGSTLVLAAARATADYKVPLVGPLAYSNKLYDPVNPYVFAVWPGYGTMVEMTTKYLITDLGKKKIGVIARAEDVGDESIAGVERAAKANGAEITARVRYELGTTDYVSVLKQVTAGNPDAVMMYGSTVDLAKMAIDLQRVNWKGVFADTAGASSPQLIKGAGAAAEGIYGLSFKTVGEDTPLWKTFVQDLEKSGTGANPKDLFTQSGYTAAQALVAAIASIKGEVTPESVRNALEGQAFNTLMGPLQWSRDNHLGLSEVLVTQVKNGSIEVIGKPLSLPKK